MKRGKRPKKALLQVSVLVAIFFLVAVATTFKTSPPSIYTEGSFSLITSEAQGDLTPLFTEAIESAEKRICCFIYALTDKQLIYALNSKAQDGVPILVIYDPTASPKLHLLLDKRIALKPYQGKGLMHIKLLTIDDATTYIGTANFTKGSLTRHGNTVAKITHPEIVDHIWAKAKGFPYRTMSQARMFTLPGYSILFSFLPDDTLAADRIKQSITAAKKTVDVAMFTFTRMDFAREIVKAAKRGVAVSVTLDDGSSRGASKKIASYLQRSPINFKKGVGKGLFHHKVARIDDNILIMGSANWTKAAFGTNCETLMVVKKLDPNHAAEGHPRLPQNPVGKRNVLAE